MQKKTNQPKKENQKIAKIKGKQKRQYAEGNKKADKQITKHNSRVRLSVKQIKQCIEQIKTENVTIEPEHQIEST